MSEQILFPDEDLLRKWVGLLERPTFFLLDFLPIIDDDWYQFMVSNIEKCKISHYPKDIHELGARLFFNITENHHYVEGNKRSAVIVIYLFFLVNDLMFSGDPQEVKGLAKRIAESKYTENPNKMNEDLEHTTARFKSMFT